MERLSTEVKRRTGAAPVRSAADRRYLSESSTSRLAATAALIGREVDAADLSTGSTH